MRRQSEQQLEQWLSTWDRDPVGVIYLFSRVVRASDKNIHNYFYISYVEPRFVVAKIRFVVAKIAWQK